MAYGSKNRPNVSDAFIIVLRVLDVIKTTATK
jgi:hypothetical protein